MGNATSVHGAVEDGMGEGIESGGKDGPEDMVQSGTALRETEQSGRTHPVSYDLRGPAGVGMWQVLLSVLGVSNARHIMITSN